MTSVAPTTTAPVQENLPPKELVNDQLPPQQQQAAGAGAQPLVEQGQPDVAVMPMSVSMPGPLPGKRFIVPLTNRGKKLASNGRDAGVNVTVSIQEARALKATGNIALTAPLFTSMTPTTGPDLTTVTITGFQFGKQGANSRVTIGAVVAPIVSWSDERVVVTATRGATTVGVATATTLRNHDMTTVGCGNFTFTS